MGPYPLPAGAATRWPHAPVHWPAALPGSPMQTLRHLGGQNASPDSLPPPRRNGAPLGRTPRSRTLPAPGKSRNKVTNPCPETAEPAGRWAPFTARKSGGDEARHPADPQQVAHVTAHLPPRPHLRRCSGGKTHWSAWGMTQNVSRWRRVPSITPWQAGPLPGIGPLLSPEQMGEHPAGSTDCDPARWRAPVERKTWHAPCIMLTARRRFLLGRASIRPRWATSSSNNLCTQESDHA